MPRVYLRGKRNRINTMLLDRFCFGTSCSACAIHIKIRIKVKKLTFEFAGQKSRHPRVPSYKTFYAPTD